jgi:hypothetical protein
MESISGGLSLTISIVCDKTDHQVELARRYRYKMSSNRDVKRFGWGANLSTLNIRKGDRNENKSNTEIGIPLKGIPMTQPDTKPVLGGVRLHQQWKNFAAGITVTLITPSAAGRRSVPCVPPMSALLPR